MEVEAKYFTGGDTTALLVFLVCVVGIFWGAMMYDMVADLYGDASGVVAWTVAVPVWTAVALLSYTIKVEDKIMSWSRFLKSALMDPAGAVTVAPAHALESQAEASGNLVLIEMTNVIFDRDSGGVC